MGTGTGKTIVSIAAAEDLLGCKDINCCLIVAPAGLKFQWAQRIAQFTDIPSHQISVKGEKLTIPRPPHGVVIDGIAEKRKRQYASITEDTDYVVLAYDNVLDDSRAVRKIKAGMTVLDEASAIKNPSAARTKKTKLILASEYRLALTATPIEKRPEELFSIMEWVDETVLGRWDFFEKSYIDRDTNGNVLGYNNLDVLHAKVSAAMFVRKRTDPDVSPFLPGVEEDTWAVHLDRPLRGAYTVVAEDLLRELKVLPRGAGFDTAALYTGNSPNESTPVGKAMAMFQACERLLDHPGLIVSSADNYEESQRRQRAGEKRKTWPGSQYCYRAAKGGLVEGLTHSAKMDLLQEKVATILDEDPRSKILIYTKYAELLDIMQNELAFLSGCVQYHGGMNARAKASAISTFTNDPAIRLFLSSHAGAYGCDMYMADHLVNVDQPPSAGKADQINGRHTRAAGEFDRVFIHNLVTVGTLEERNMAKLGYERKIGEAIIDGRGHTRGRLDNEVERLTAYLDRTVGIG